MADMNRIIEMIQAVMFRKVTWLLPAGVQMDFWVWLLALLVALIVLRYLIGWIITTMRNLLGW